MRRCLLTLDLCGLTVARPVRNASDTVLLAKGVVLEARVIEVLMSLGVTDVYVQVAHDDTPPSPAENAAREAIAARERRRFGDVASDPCMAALLAATIELKGSDWERWAGGGERPPSPATNEDGSPDA